MTGLETLPSPKLLDVGEMDTVGDLVRSRDPLTAVTCISVSVSVFRPPSLAPAAWRRGQGSYLSGTCAGSAGSSTAACAAGMRTATPASAARWRCHTPVSLWRAIARHVTQTLVSSLPTEEQKFLLRVSSKVWSSSRTRLALFSCFFK